MAHLMSTKCGIVWTLLTVRFSVSSVTPFRAGILYQPSTNYKLLERRVQSINAVFHEQYCLWALLWMHGLLDGKREWGMQLHLWCWRCFIWCSHHIWAYILVRSWTCTNHLDNGASGRHAAPCKVRMAPFVHYSSNIHNVAYLARVLNVMMMS